MRINRSAIPNLTDERDVAEIVSASYHPVDQLLVSRGRRVCLIGRNRACRGYRLKFRIRNNRDHVPVRNDHVGSPCSSRTISAIP